MMLAGLLQIPRLVLRVMLFMVRFDAGNARIEELSLIMGESARSRDAIPVSMRTLARVISVSGKAFHPIQPRVCLARAFCLAEHWRDEFGRPVINVGVGIGGDSSAFGHVWITVDEDHVWQADVSMSEHYSVLLSDTGAIRYWFQGTGDGHE